MTPKAYHNRGTTHPGIDPVKPPSAQHKRFARALSAAVARRMQQNGLDCLYALYKLIPETAGIAPMTVYSALYVSTRPSVWVMAYIAVALDTTLTTLVSEAHDLLASGKPFKTAGEVFKGAKAQGRKKGPPRDESKRWKKKK